SVRAAIRKLHRDVTRESIYFVLTFPLSFEFLADCRAAWREFHLGRSGFFQDEWRAVSALPEFAGEMTVRVTMRPDFCLARAFASQSAFDGESQVGTFHVEVYERRALHSEAGN